MKGAREHHGSVVFNRRSDSWHFLWLEEGKRRFPSNRETERHPYQSPRLARGGVFKIRARQACGKARKCQVSD
jgi:hypothetical protein